MINKKHSPILIDKRLPNMVYLVYNKEKDNFEEFNVPNGDVVAMCGILWSILNDNKFIYERLGSGPHNFNLTSKIFGAYTRVAFYCQNEPDLNLATEYIEYFTKKIAGGNSVEIVSIENNDVIVEIASPWFTSPTSTAFILNVVRTSLIYTDAADKTPLEFLAQYINFVPNQYNTSIECVLDKFEHEDFGWSYQQYSDSYCLSKNCALEYHGCLLTIDNQIKISGPFYTQGSKTKIPNTFSSVKGSLTPTLNVEISERVQLYFFQEGFNIGIATKEVKNSLAGNNRYYQHGSYAISTEFLKNPLLYKDLNGVYFINYNDLENDTLIPGHLQSKLSTLANRKPKPQEKVGYEIERFLYDSKPGLRNSEERRGQGILDHLSDRMHKSSSSDSWSFKILDTRPIASAAPAKPTANRKVARRAAAVEAAWLPQAEMYPQELGKKDETQPKSDQ